MNSERDARRGGLSAWQLLALWGPPVAWMGVIFFMSSQSALGGMEGPPLFQALRKVGHIIEYSVLGVLLGRALAATWIANGAERRQGMLRAILARAWWVGAGLATLYAVTDELHQSFVPRRGAHVEDVLIDALSAIAALGIWYISQLRDRRNPAGREPF
jgi:VanZ family protein